MHNLVSVYLVLEIVRSLKITEFTRLFFLSPTPSAIFNWPIWNLFIFCRWLSVNLLGNSIRMSHNVIGVVMNGFSWWLTISITKLRKLAVNESGTKIKSFLWLAVRHVRLFEKSYLNWNAQTFNVEISVCVPLNEYPTFHLRRQQTRKRQPQQQQQQLRYEQACEQTSTWLTAV